MASGSSPILMRSGPWEPTGQGPQANLLRATYAIAGLACREVSGSRVTGSIDGIGNVLGTSPKPGRSCWRARISKARILRAGSMGRSGHLCPGSGPCDQLRSFRRGTVEVAAWCDEEGHFGHFLGSRSYAGLVSEADIDAARPHSAEPCWAFEMWSCRPRAVTPARRYVGYLEAHIEQGDTLETGGLAIGMSRLSSVSGNTDQLRR